ncbi:GNAT family N-acetyltransferase [Yoonia sp. R78084]|uniref:GNAT family N-acetyltransferase n=1 Tax=Yoonia sp. R78084 TaxID=3093869 RepID=UPI0037DC79E9
MRETITLRRLGPEDLDVLMAVEEGLFDNAILPDQAEAFLNDGRHEMVLAFDGGDAVGMASGQELLHPDKAPAFFINEVGVRESHQRRGIATALCNRLIEVARTRGCEGIWLATEGDNGPARSLYRAMGARETADIVVYDWDGALDR